MSRTPPSNTFVTKRGDYGKPIRIQLLKQKKPFDITAADVRFHMKGGADNETVASGDMDIVDAEASIVEYTFTGTELDETGTFYGEVEMDALGGPVTFPEDGYFNILVQADLDE